MHQFSANDTTKVKFKSDEVKLVANVFNKSSFGASHAKIGGELIEQLNKAATDTPKNGVTLTLSHDKIALMDFLLDKAMFTGSVLDCAMRCRVCVTNALQTFYKPREVTQ